MVTPLKTRPSGKYWLLGVCCAGRYPSIRSQRTPPKMVSLVLLDATTGAELASLDKIENAISL